jgi:hypothetical protein
VSVAAKKVEARFKRMFPKLFAAPKEPSSSTKKKKAKKIVATTKKKPATPTATQVISTPVVVPLSVPTPASYPSNKLRLIYQTDGERQMAIAQHLWHHPLSVHFREPVPLDFLDGQYHQTIKEPMDLATLMVTYSPFILISFFFSSIDI